MFYIQHFQWRLPIPPIQQVFQSAKSTSGIYHTVENFYSKSNKLKKKQLNKILKNELRTFWIFDVLFYRRHVLEITDGFESPGGVKWDITLCNLLAWTIIFIVLSKGIKTLGKVRYAEEERIFLKSWQGDKTI